ncbi:transglycosylase family protein [Streptomyces sp. NPDC046759]|uniref:transglycosylase family protein n=1 Tax=Streptomyces sp. NPDC046759 TaxID=3155019 RepID=UPI0034012E5E
MLSGNGRHRRPRQAPALLVAAGVTGSAIAIPLLGAASANAADGTTWDKVAECESGGSWSADTGNGYYGGLQISQDDWDRYGGTQYAQSADQASRNQQIAVAEKILADQGTKPWTTCALLSGLTSGSASADVDTGVGGPGDTSGSGGGSDSSGLPDSSSDSGPGSDSGTGSGSNAGAATDSSGSDSSGSSSAGSEASTTPAPSPSEGVTGTPEATGTPDAAGGSAGTGTATPESDKSGKSGSSDGGGSQGGDSSSTAAPDVDNSDNYQQSAGSWSLIDTGALGSGGRHRGTSADESATNGQNAPSSGRHAGQGPDTYTVREGDSLASIADSLGVHGGWHALYEGNKKAIGADPNRITAGQTLKVEGEKGDG